MEMKELLINAIVMLLKLLTPAMVKDIAASILDYAERKVLGTKSKIDDKFVLPVTDLLQATFGIPDREPDVIPEGLAEPGSEEP